MAFILDSFENIDFEIPDGKGGTTKISVPPLDCFLPSDVEKMNKTLEAVPDDTPVHRHPGKNASALIQHMLAYYNPKAKTAIWSLVPRHVAAINDHWDKSSEVVLGESSASTGASTETKQ